MGLIQYLKNLFCPKKSGTRLAGTIKFFDRKKRFGFIVADKQEYFFHATATHPKNFRALQDGAKVTFILIQGKKGPQADSVEIVR